MSREVGKIVKQRLNGSEMDGAAAAAVAAAFEGDDALARALEDPAAHLVEPEEDTASDEADLVWLAGIGLCGFRGVAGRVDVPLVPAPGLVVVGGRNGAGKSSVAEAAELALSGRSERSQVVVWREGLSNLHHDGPAEVEVVLRAGADEVRLGLSLDGDSLANARPWATRGGAAVEPATLGWEEAAVRYRPVLTYSELAALASTAPSKLYDPLNLILGLDRLTEADKRLTGQMTTLARAGKEAKPALKSLLTDLDGCADDRAPALRTALASKPPDTVAARTVLAGGADDGSRPRLKLWAAVAPPDPAAAATAAAKLGEALDRHAAAQQGAAGQAKRLSDLLDLAVAHRGDESGCPCPVCGKGVLDDDWLRSAREASARHRGLALEATAADAELVAARAAARAAAPQIPSALLGPAAAGVDPAPARLAWEALASLAAPGVADDRGLAGALPAAAADAAAQAAALRASAREALASQDEAWEPLAKRAGEVVALLDAQVRADAGLAAATAARAWLRDVGDEIREERLKPFAAQISDVWEGLRQESNVSLGGVRLVGANTRREVELDLRVDDEPGSRAVLSQGELAALGLAVFLPRSAADESPFRFVLVDDPVQSLDPTKVDGLAQVLHGLAADRQVVVFTHDDRLLQSLKRLGLPCTALRIDRGERSVVTVETVLDPVEQHLRDADALAKDTVLPADLVALAVTGYCRDALNETAIDLARRRLHADGGSVEDVERAVAAANGRTRKLLALALLGDASRDKGPLNKVLVDVLPDAGEIVGQIVEGIHDAAKGDGAALLASTRRLVDALRPAP